MHNVPGFAACGAVATTGFLGDALSGAHYGDSPTVPLSLAQHIVLCSDKPPDADIASYYPEEVAEIRDHVRSLFLDNADIPPHQRLMRLDLTIRQATFISTMFSICNWFVPLVAPFFNRPLMRAFCMSSFEVLQGQKLYDQWLEKRRQDLAIAADTGWRHQRFRVANQLWRARYRRRPVGKISWLDAYDRSQSWIASELESISGELGAISRTSYEFMKEHRPEIRPALTQSIALARSFRT